MKTSDQIIIEELKRIILMQAQEIAKITLLMARIDFLERELARYTTRKDSNNSSLPPSKDENRPPRTSSLREKSNRKAGGQPGHEGKTLEMTETPDEIIEHHSYFCPECGKDVSDLPFEFSGKRQVIDIPTIKQIVTEHRVYRCKCSCGKIVESDFSVGVDSPVRFRAMLREAHKLKKQFTPADYYYPNHLRSLLEKELDNLLSESLDPKHKEMIAFQKRITKYRDYVFTFLYHPTVPPDNNGSERAIRNVKVKQKISGQFKIFSAAENFAILRFIIDTALKNNQNVLQAYKML